VIDVDILLFGDERISEKGLEVPHPGISQRPFVLEPLRELGVKRAGRW
jgi:2-amino-4-hydroxy-6-hydroxymethyldihydropteridine diphosphokinase